MTDTPLEIERKFILKRPPKDMLYHQPINIEQYYLPRDEDGYTVRIRRKECNGKVTCILTKKLRVSDMTCEEIERDISFSEFRELQSRAISEVSKTRYNYKVGNDVWEIDIFNGIKLILAEIELSDEGDVFEVSSCMDDVIIAEVTGIDGFYNENLATPTVK